MATTKDFRFRQSIGWEDAFRQLTSDDPNPYIAAELADARDRNLEEWLSKHVVTTVNPTGDVTIGTGQTLNVDGSAAVGGSLDVTGSITVPAGSFGNADIADLSASKLTAGTIDASVITVTNINASNITTGTLNAGVISVTNLNADNITTGTLTLTSGEAVQSTGSGHRTAIFNSTTVWGGDPYTGLSFHTGLAGEADPGFIGCPNNEYRLLIQPPLDADIYSVIDMVSKTGTSDSHLSLSGGGATILLKDNKVHLSGDPLYFGGEGTNDYVVFDDTNNEYEFFADATEIARFDNGDLRISGTEVYFNGMSSNDYISFGEASNTWGFFSDGVERIRFTQGDIAIASDTITFNGISGNDTIAMSESLNRFTVTVDGTAALTLDADDPFIFIPAVYNNTDASAANVYVNSSGSIKRSTSTIALKDNAREYEDSDVFDLITPARWDRKADGVSQFGFVAEWNKAVAPEFSAHQDDQVDIPAVLAATVARVKALTKEVRGA